MFYMLYHCFKTMESYIHGNFDCYDMCIRARPDLNFTKPVSLDDINTFRKGHLITKITTVGGVNDAFFMCDTVTMKKICLLWEAAFKEKRLSPFPLYPQATAHDLLLLWLIKNNIYVVNKDFTASTLECAQDSIPDISEELLHDANNEGKKFYKEILELHSYLYKK